ncbi:MAG TPA: ABC transporter permease subunit [Trueperaceae bacterium]
MNWRAVRAIIRKDLSVVRQSRAIMLPLVIVPIVVLVALPALASFAPNLVNLPGAGNDLSQLLEAMPAGLQAVMEGRNEEQRLLLMLLVYIFAPLYLIVPIMVANVIAADSFAGEKERKTLEALLYTPTSDRELVTAKLMAPWLAAVAVALLGFVAYSLVVNITNYRTMGGIFFPNLMWLVLALWVAPAVAAFGLAGGVLVSARVNTVQEAYQLGGVVVLPIVLLMVSQAVGVIYFSIGLVLLLGLLIWAIALALLWYGVRTLRRERLVARI